MRVAVTGSAGTVGSALCEALVQGGHVAVPLVRGPDREGRLWDPAAPAPNLLSGVDALVHLAGEPIGKPFTERHKAAVRDSRVGPTRRLAELAGKVSLPVMVVASAIGFYGHDRGDEELTEESHRGEGFLARVVDAWEGATEPARDGGAARVVNVRTGMVQAAHGGTLRLMRPLFAAGLGGPIGDGRQWVSWIAIDDLVDIYMAAVTDDGLNGPVNAVSPNPVRNHEYATMLGRVLHRPARLRTPMLGLRLLLRREGATELAGASQRVVPKKLLEAGYRFRHPELEGALEHLLHR